MIFHSHIIFLYLSSFLPFSTCHQHSPLLPTITAPAGTIIGTTTVYTTLPTHLSKAHSSTKVVHKFLGIPYAKPPIRFELAEELEAQRCIDARKFSKMCIQQNNETASTASMFESEDCLYLNIWTLFVDVKEGRKTSKKAVMLWIHGGNLETGAGSLEAFDGSGFVAEQDVVVVTFNYRLNAFGFPNIPITPSANSNPGFHDQRLALTWVFNNIASFDGDPERITLFGESAGASSIDRLLLLPPTISDHSSPHRKPRIPFRAAILQSGQATISAIQLDTGPSAWSTLVSKTNCATTPYSAIEEVACVRAIDAFVIRNIVSSLNLGFRPVNDNITQLATPALKRRATGDVARVPMLIGNNGQEANMFLEGYGIRNTSLVGHDTVEALILSMIGDDEVKLRLWLGYVEQIRKMMPWLDELEALLVFATDIIWDCPTRYVSEASAQRGIPTWRYYYNATIPNLQVPGYQNLGAYHGSEIELVFGTYNSSGAVKQEIGLSRYMQKAWANFAKDPWAGPGWSRVSRRKTNLACLGCDGGSGLSIIASKDVDDRCEWYTFDATLPDI